MSQFTRTRVRCPLYPAKVDEAFKTLGGDTPKIYKNAGCEFELALFDGTDLFNVSNIISFTISVKAKNNPSSAALMLKTVAAPDINTTLAPGQWTNGSDQHVVIPFLGTETGLAEGHYDVTVSGFTIDNSIDPDVFAISDLFIKDAGITGLISPPVVPGSGITTDQILGLLAQYVPYNVPPGKSITLMDAGSRIKRILAVTDETPLGPTPTPIKVDSLEFP